MGTRLHEKKSMRVGMKECLQIREKGEKMEDKLLIKIAMEAREKSYSPYSKYKVGAAVYTRSGKVFTGCNIESASYTPTICAERVAVSKCISEGYMDIDTIAVVGSEIKTSFPCGV